MAEEKIRKDADTPVVSVPAGIGLAALKRGIRWAYKRHRYRYHAWDQAGYRFFVQTVAGSIVLVLLVSGAWLGRAALRRQEDKLAVGKAAACLAQRDYGAASRNASRALALNPFDARACRVMAECASRMRLPAELSWWQRVVQLAPTAENKLALASAGLHCQMPPYPLTTQILDDLTAIGPTNASYQELAARLAWGEHVSAEAKYHLVTACELDPGNHEYALNLAMFQLNAAKGGAKIPLRKQVAGLALDKDLRPTALRALAADTLAEGDAGAALSYSTQLLATSEASLTDQLRDLEILQRLNSSSFAARLLSVESQAEADPQVTAQMCDWMRAHGLVTQNIDWLTSLPDNVLTRPPVAAALARSYLQNGNWQTLLDFASHGDWEDLDFLRLAAISHAWAELGMVTLAESNWGEAVGKAGDRMDAVTNLLELAQEWQLTTEAEDLRQRERQLAR